jgi:ANTAR domain
MVLLPPAAVLGNVRRLAAYVTELLAPGDPDFASFGWLVLPTSAPLQNGVPYPGAARFNGDGRHDLSRAAELAAAATRLARAPDVASLWPMIVAEALSLVGGDGVAVLRGQEAVWRVVVHDQRDAPAADRLDTALLDACEQGLFDDPGVLADSEAADHAETGSWRILLVCELAGTSHRERLRLVWFSAEPAAFSADLGLAELFAQHAGAALVGVTERVTLEQAIAARHRIGQAQGIVMARLDLTVEESFEFLRRTSQQHNVKLRDLADQIIATRSLPALDNAARGLPEGRRRP